MLYLFVLSVVLYYGLENEIYFKCFLFEINSFVLWFKKCGIFYIFCICLSWGFIVYFIIGFWVYLMDFIGI